MTGLAEFAASIGSGLLKGGGGGAVSTAATATGGSMLGSLAGMAAGPVGGLASMVLGGIASAAATRKERDVERVRQGNQLFASAYEKALAEYYQRKGNAEKRMALENYNQFNTMDQIAPGYKDVYTPAALGDMPDVTDYMAHRRNKKNKVKVASQQARSDATVGSVTVPGG